MSKEEYAVEVENISKIYTLRSIKQIRKNFTH